VNARDGTRSALVTGGAGFIGGHLAERLLAEGWSVRVLDDFSSGRESNLAGCGGRVDLLRGDVRDPDTLARALDGVGVIFHHAAVASVPRSVAEPLLTNSVNIGGTLMVLESARAAGVRRVVYAASSYALQKFAGEEYCRLYHAFYGLETVCLRYFNVYGPRQDPESEYAAVIPRFATAALSGTPAEIYGDGEQTRDFVFVGDAVEANLLAADAKAASGQVVNIASGRRTSLNQLWEEICDLAGVMLEARYAAPRTGDVRDSLASVERAGELLGYEPSVDLREGLRQTIESFRKTREPERG